MEYIVQYPNAHIKRTHSKRYSKEQTIVSFDIDDRMKIIVLNRASIILERDLNNENLINEIIDGEIVKTHDLFKSKFNYIRKHLSGLWKGAKWLQSLQL